MFNNSEIGRTVFAAQGSPPKQDPMRSNASPLELALPVTDRPLAATQVMIDSLANALPHQVWGADQLHARLILATRATGEGVWDWDQANALTYYSAQWQGLLGLPEEELTSSPEHFCRLLYPDDQPRFLDFCRGSDDVDGGQFEGEFRMLHADGQWRWILIRGIRVHDATNRGLLRVVGTISDVTSHRLLDTLTGLHNRFALIERVERRLKLKDDRPFALLFLDVDSFRRINDSFTHWHGDTVLVEVARRIQSTVASEPSSLAVRLSGDEFVIMLDYMSEEDVGMYTLALQIMLQAPVACGEQELYLTVSMGAAMSMTGYANAEDMLQDAEMAMYRAKMAGKATSCFFTLNLREEVRRNMRVESELRQALAENELTLHYQPKVLLKTGEIIGFEALVRWNHPKRGLIGPGEFIPIAESTDLILQIGRWTMFEAIRQTSAWIRAGVVPPDFTVAVNLSTRQFADNHLVKDVVATLLAENLQPSRLEIEVTESALIDNTDSALNTLNELKRLGVGLDLDDFGMGYSSLSYLHRLPFDTLKVDRSFVMGLGADDESSVIARSIIALGAALNMKVLAEGIETADQTTRLIAMGCIYGQGYHFSRPLPPAECERLMEKHARSRDVSPGRRRSVAVPAGALAVPVPHQVTPVGAALLA
jgi:diguanylate cyclase (GGDEF)-like protein/PAS domain S-box-containing protein